MKVPAIVAVIALAFANCANAELQVSFDMDPTTTDTIEANRTVIIGETFYVDVVFSMTGDISLSSYNFSARFDTDELDFVGRQETPPAPLGQLDKTNPFDEFAGSGDPVLGAANFGQLRRFDGATLFDGLVGPDIVRVATLEFTAVAPSGGDTDIDLIAGRFEPRFDFFFDNNGGDFSAEVIFRGGSVSTVPEPSSLVLMGVAAMCLGGWHLRRRRK